MAVRRLACAFVACVLSGAAFGQEKQEKQEPKGPRLRVFYLEGSIRWDYRFLKNALIGDPSLSVQIYLTIASEDFQQESSAGLPSLTGLPEKDEGLAAYDVVVLGDLPEEWLREKGAGLGKHPPVSINDVAGHSPLARRVRTDPES